MLIYEEKGLGHHGARSGHFAVSLTNTHFNAYGIGIGFASILINRPIEALQSVVWTRDLLGYNIAVNFIDTDGHIK